MPMFNSNKEKKEYMVEVLGHIDNKTDATGEVAIRHHIIESLTPPTADEVCEALNKDLVQIDETHNVKYDKGKRMFYDSLVSDVYPIANQQMYDTNKVKIHQEFLSPDVLIMIGRFYEGLE